MKKWFLRLAPLVLALVMVCGSCLTAFASDYVFPVGSNSSGKYWVEVLRNDGVTVCFSSDSPYYVEPLNGGDKNEPYFMARGIGDEWIDGVPSGHSTGILYAMWDPKDGVAGRVWITVVSSNHDILWEDGSLFFQAPSVLEPVVKGAGMEKVLEQLMTILPIGLVCLVGWIALRKALAILPRILHRA